MNFKKIAIFSAVVILSSNLFGENLVVKILIKPTFYEKLLKNGNISDSRDDGSSKLDLLPETIYADKMKNELISKKDGNYPFTYETLYLLNKKAVLEKSNSSSKEIGIPEISKICRSVSKMKGMTYYSSTRKKEQVLYENAYMIESPDSKKAIKDQNSGNSNGQTSYCLLDDNSFGPCRYKLNYFEAENEILCVFENLDILGLGPFKAVHPGKMTIKILVQDCGEDVILYICCDLDSVKYPGIKAQITDSMVSRIEALYNWVITQF